MEIRHGQELLPAGKQPLATRIDAVTAAVLADCLPAEFRAGHDVSVDGECGRGDKGLHARSSLSVPITPAVTGTA